MCTWRARKLATGKWPQCRAATQGRRCRLRRAVAATAQEASNARRRAARADQLHARKGRVPGLRLSIDAQGAYDVVLAPHQQKAVQRLLHGHAWWRKRHAELGQG